MSDVQVPSFRRAHSSRFLAQIRTKEKGNADIFLIDVLCEQNQQEVHFPEWRLPSSCTRASTTGTSLRSRPRCTAAGGDEIGPRAREREHSAGARSDKSWVTRMSCTVLVQLASFIRIMEFGQTENATEVVAICDCQGNVDHDKFECDDIKGM